MTNTTKDSMAYFGRFLKRILPWLKFIMLTYLWTKSDICSFASLTIIFIQRIIETAKFWAGPWAEPFWSEEADWIKLEKWKNWPGMKVSAIFCIVFLIKLVSVRDPQTDFRQFQFNTIVSQNMYLVSFEL